jgi:hypothetical protein
VAQIKTFEGACKKLKLDPKGLPNVSKLPVRHQNAMIAHYKLVIITEALNEEWTADWNNTSQTKYYPYFWVKANAKKPSGVGLSYGGYGAWDSVADVGSRLCFKNRELAAYAGKTFIKLYEESYLLQ